MVNTRRALEVADVIRDHGGVPYVPHLSLFWHMARPAPYDVWLGMDLELIRSGKVDAVYRIPGESPGADREEIAARETGLLVLRTLDELRAWLGMAEGVERDATVCAALSGLAREVRSVRESLERLG